MLVEQLKSIVGDGGWTTDEHELQPHLSEWIGAAQTPEAEPLLQYASALLAGCRLEELGYLTAFLARECHGRPAWDSVLRRFMLEVDGWVLARYGGRFAPAVATLKTLT